MDSFEYLVAALLRAEGYWTDVSLRVSLTREDKVAIGRNSTPRWEIDVVGYRPKDDEVLVIECKSYFDSRGVTYRDLCTNLDKSRYKLFVEPRTREIVLGRLMSQLRKLGSVSDNARPVLCLAAGKIRSAQDESQLLELFASHGWRLFGETWLKNGLQLLSQNSYENSVASVVAKILLRVRTSLND